MKKLTSYALLFITLNVVLYFVFNEGALIPVQTHEYINTFDWASDYYKPFQSLFTFFSDVVDFVSKLIEKIMTAIDVVTNLTQKVVNGFKAFGGFLKNIFS